MSFDLSVGLAWRQYKPTDKRTIKRNANNWHTEQFIIMSNSNHFFLIGTFFPQYQLHMASYSGTDEYNTFTLEIRIFHSTKTRTAKIKIQSIYIEAIIYISYFIQTKTIYLNQIQRHSEKNHNSRSRAKRMNDSPSNSHIGSFTKTYNEESSNRNWFVVCAFFSVACSLRLYHFSVKHFVCSASPSSAIRCCRLWSVHFFLRTNATYFHEFYYSLNDFNSMPAASTQIYLCLCMY